jgi:hypothetical protein
VMCRPPPKTAKFRCRASTATRQNEEVCEKMPLNRGVSELVPGRTQDFTSLTCAVSIPPVETD